jgi:hypothetical protein
MIEIRPTSRRGFIKGLATTAILPALAFADDNTTDVWILNKKFCPECQKLGLKSKVFIGGCTSTLLNCGSGYYDEDGDYHPPDPCNTTTCEYTCSNGHTWMESE